MTRSRAHLVPTHIRVPETLLTLAGINVTVRQFLLLLVGIALSYRVWLGLTLFALLPGGQAARVLVTTLPCALALALAFVQIAARPLDVWCVVVARYLLRPHISIWRSVRFHEPIPAGLGNEDTHETR